MLLLGFGPSIQGKPEQDRYTGTPEAASVPAAHGGGDPVLGGRESEPDTGLFLLLLGGAEESRL